MAKTDIPSKDTTPSTEPNRHDRAAESFELDAAEIAVRASSTAVLEEILSRADSRPYEHWGINE